MKPFPFKVGDRVYHKTVHITGTIIELFYDDSQHLVDWESKNGWCHDQTGALPENLELLPSMKIKIVERKPEYIVI